MAKKRVKKQLGGVMPGAGAAGVQRPLGGAGVARPLGGGALPGTRMIKKGGAIKKAKGGRVKAMHGGMKTNKSKKKK